MYKLVNLTLKNINIFREISKFNNVFILSNKNFLKEYHNSNFIQKLFLRKSVNLLFKGSNFVGYIWFEKHNKHHSSINSINLIEDNNLAYCYELLIAPLLSSSLITYECESNEVSTDILSKLGFEKTKGFMELEKQCTEYHNMCVPKNITFSIIERDKDEKVRCLLQNEIFKNDDRAPINIEDIYYDEAQDYYFNKGAIFIKLDNIPIGYGQIIVEDNKAIIVNFGIVEKYRRTGYGKELLSYLLNIAKDNDFSKVSLRVDSSNHVALNLYLSLGFHIKRQFYTWQKTKT